MIATFSARNWNDFFQAPTQQNALDSLENGQILYFPHFPFALSTEETCFLSPDYADPHSKNIGFDLKTNTLWGVQHLSDEQHIQLKSLLTRFSHSATNLVQRLLSHYANNLILGRTSFRPVEISVRKTSYRKDDKRLHVDAFPSAPNQGKRILRVFRNINPHHQARIWRVGEPFEQVVERFIPLLKKPFPGSNRLLRLLKITKSHRTLYDHYMLQLHNQMKADNHYQKNAQQQEIHFPANSAWIVQTDHVSHAAMAGQYVLEQTFYLPIDAMQDQNKSPLRILETFFKQHLV